MVFDLLLFMLKVKLSGERNTVDESMIQEESTLSAAHFL